VKVNSLSVDNVSKTASFNGYEFDMYSDAWELNKNKALRVDFIAEFDRTIQEDIPVRNHYWSPIKLRWMRVRLERIAITASVWKRSSIALSLLISLTDDSLPDGTLLKLSSELEMSHLDKALDINNKKRLPKIEKNRQSSVHTFLRPPHALSKLKMLGSW